MQPSTYMGAFVAETLIFYNNAYAKRVEWAFRYIFPVRPNRVHLLNAQFHKIYFVMCF